MVKLIRERVENKVEFYCLEMAIVQLYNIEKGNHVCIRMLKFKGNHLHAKMRPCSTHDNGFEREVQRSASGR